MAFYVSQSIFLSWVKFLTFVLPVLQKELREEDRRYREHLKQLYEEEKIRERELEALIQQEVERMWQKRLAQWKLEREARKKLMQDVLVVRAEQVQERCKSLSPLSLLTRCP